VLSTIVQVVGLLLLAAAGFAAGVTVGLAVAGLLLLVVGVLLERKGS
jgi:hypothetical protein